MPNFTAPGIAVLVLLAMIFLRPIKPPPVAVRVRSGSRRSEQDPSAQPLWSRSEWLLVAAVVIAVAVNVAMSLAGK